MERIITSVPEKPKKRDTDAASAMKAHRRGSERGRFPSKSIPKTLSEKSTGCRLHARSCWEYSLPMLGILTTQDAAMSPAVDCLPAFLPLQVDELLGARLVSTGSKLNFGFSVPIWHLDASKWAIIVVYDVMQYWWPSTHWLLVIDFEGGGRKGRVEVRWGGEAAGLEFSTRWRWARRAIRRTRSHPTKHSISGKLRWRCQRLITVRERKKERKKEEKSNLQGQKIEGKKKERSKPNQKTQPK